MGNGPTAALMNTREVTSAEAQRVAALRALEKVTSISETPV
jgi:hypothetical protein